MTDEELDWLENPVYPHNRAFEEVHKYFGDSNSVGLADILIELRQIKWLLEKLIQ